MTVRGICEVQMPFLLQLAMEAVLGAHSVWSTDRRVSTVVPLCQPCGGNPG